MPLGERQGKTAHVQLAIGGEMTIRYVESTSIPEIADAAQATARAILEDDSTGLRER